MTEQPTPSPWKRKSGFESGCHYSTFTACGANAMRGLREMLPDGNANEWNFCLFSTSGVHGSYATIEDIEASFQKYGLSPDFLKDESEESIPGDYHHPEITFFLVQPRICCHRYGNVAVESQDDIDFLKRLRQTSWDAVLNIGRAEEPQSGGAA